MDVRAASRSCQSMYRERAQIVQSASARLQNRQVAINGRCGIQGDFNTPEYTTNSDIVGFKWESNRGMDPFSFGYNYLTPDNQYLHGNDIVQSLVDKAHGLPDLTRIVERAVQQEAARVADERGKLREHLAATYAEQPNWLEGIDRVSPAAHDIIALTVILPARGN